MSLTCKQMRFVNDLFYKRSSLWWFLYEHISGLASALLNHLHTGNWSWEYYSHVRPHYSVRKAWRHNWVRGTFKSSYSCMQGNPGFHNYLTTKVRPPPNRREDGSSVTLLLPAQNVTADSGSRVFSHTLYGFAGHWITLRSHPEQC